MFRFLRILALLPVLFMTSNLMAAGYTCDENIEYTECDNGYFLNRTGAGNTCQACSTVANNNGAVLDTENILNGERELVCVGNYTGGAGGTSVGSGACTGCTSAQWECVCADGYVAKGTGQACTCEKASGFVCDSEKKYDSCNPGYYMATLSNGTYAYNGTPAAGNACVACPAGHWCAGGTAAPTQCGAGTYSAGGVAATTAAACTACPDATSARAVASDLPVDFYFKSFGNSSISGAPAGATNINQCKTLNWVESTRGQLYYYAGFNSASNRYSDISDYGWSDVAAGYYLTERGGCGSFAYYKKVEVCPAGRSCPGKTRVECNAGNKDEVHTETFGLGDECKAGTWAAEGAASCTSCAIGTYTGDENGNNATGATSAAACKACPAAADHKTVTVNGLVMDDRLGIWQMDKGGNSSVYSAGATINSIANQSWGGVGNIAECKVTYTFTNAAGRIVAESVTYNIDNDTYDIAGKTGPMYINQLNPGYYERERYSDTYCNKATNPQYYQKLYICPAGSYCPGLTALGGSHRLCSATGDDAYLNNDTFGLKPCAAGSYQPKIGQSSCELAQPGYYVGTTGATKETVCGNVNANGYANFPTYSETAGATECTPCPLAKQYVDKIEAYYYSSLTGGKPDSINGCIVRFNDNGGVDDTTFTVDHGSVAQRTHCYWDRNGDYGVSSGYGSPGCGGWQADVTCDGGYYNTTDTNKKQYYYATLDLLVKNVCGQHGGEYYSPDGDPYGYKCPDAPADLDEYSDHLTIVGDETCLYNYNDMPLDGGTGTISDISCEYSEVTDTDSPFVCDVLVDGMNPDNITCSGGYYHPNTEDCNCWEYDADGECVDLECVNGFEYEFASLAEILTGKMIDPGTYLCMPVGKGYASPANEITRTACSAVRATVGPDVYGTGISSVPTYSDTETATECTACPAVQSDWKDTVSNYGYWSSNGLNDDVTRCHVGLKPIEPDHGDIEAGAYCYWSPKADGYGISETSSGSADAVNGRGCFLPQAKLKCDDQYYSTAAGASQQFFVNLALLKSNACTPVELGYYSPAGSIMQTACPVGEDTNISQQYAGQREWVNEKFFGTNRCAHTYGNVGSTTAEPFVQMTNLRCSLSSDYKHYVCGADSVTKVGGRWNEDKFNVGHSDYEMDDEDVCFGHGWSDDSENGGRYCSDGSSDDCEYYDEEVYCGDAWNGEIYEHPYDGSELYECSEYCNEDYGYGSGSSCDYWEWISGEYCGSSAGTLYALTENSYCSDISGESCEWYDEEVYCGDYYDEDRDGYYFHGVGIWECDTYCGNEDEGTEWGSSCDYWAWFSGDICEEPEDGSELMTCDDLRCPDYYNPETGKYMFGEYELKACYEEDAYWVPMPAGLIPEWYVWDIDTVQARTPTTPGYYSSAYDFGRYSCSSDSSYYASYQDLPAQSSCKYCRNLAGGLFPAGSADGGGNTSLMDSPYDCYGNGTGAYTSSNSNTGGCVAGYYLTYTDPSNPETAYCASVGAGHWSAGGQKVYYGKSGSYNSCPAGETTVGYGIGADEAGDCGYKMHVGNSEMYLRSTKLTTPALNVLRNGKTYYANMTPAFDFKVSKDATQSFRAEYDGQEYWIYDQSAQPVLDWSKKSYNHPSYSPTSSNYDRYGGYDNATGVWKVVPNASAASAGYPTVTGVAAYHSKTYSYADAGKLGSSISANFEPNNTKSGNNVSIWCKVTDPVGNDDWVLVEYSRYCSGTNCNAAYECAYYGLYSSLYPNVGKSLLGTMGYLVK